MRLTITTCTTHPVHQYLDNEAWDDDGKCIDESLLFCTANKIQIENGCAGKGPVKSK